MRAAVLAAWAAAALRPSDLHAHPGVQADHAVRDPGGMAEGDAGGAEDICRFRDPALPWAAHRAATNLRGQVLFNPQARGQGLGSVFSGLAAAALYAVRSQRRLVLDHYGVFADDLLPPSREHGPETRPPKLSPAQLAALVKGARSATACDCRVELFAVQNSSHDTDPDAVAAQMRDADRCPTLCYFGNAGGLGAAEAFAAPAFPAGYPFFGCAFHYLFDVSRSRAAPSPRAPGYRVAGHLRLGDAHMGSGDTGADAGRPVLAAVHGDVQQLAAEFLGCAQALAQQKAGGGPCTVVLLSDTPAVKRAWREAAAASSPCGVEVSGTAPVFVTANGQHGDGSTADGVEEALRDFLELATADATLTSASNFGEAASRLGPALRDAAGLGQFSRQRHTYSFEAALQRRAAGSQGPALCALD